MNLSTDENIILIDREICSIIQSIYNNVPYNPEYALSDIDCFIENAKAVSENMKRMTAKFGELNKQRFDLLYRLMNEVGINYSYRIQ